MSDEVMPHEEIPSTAADELLTLKQVAAVLQISDSSLRNAKAQGKAPQFIRIPGVGLRCRRSTLDNWLAEQELV